MSLEHHEMTRILEDIDRGLDFFGKGVKEVVYFKLNQSMKMERSDIVNEPEKFVSCLEEMFGIGSFRVEKSIMKEIANDFGIDHPVSLASAIKQARSQIYSGNAV